MKLLINTSAVPFNDADQRAICPLGRRHVQSVEWNDRNAGRQCRQMDQPPGARRAPCSPEEDAGQVGIEGDGPTLGGQDLRAFSESPRITRTHFRGFGRS